jgi:drug/metabolite transporter (DMT)-like permease
VLLMYLGSVPFWCLLLVIVTPPLPSGGQILNTALVALFSGIMATSLFLYARSKSKTGGHLAAVDATQSSEVIFALSGEILILGAGFPNYFGLLGILVTGAGLMLFVRFQNVAT